MIKPRAPRNLYGRAIRVGVGVGAGDVKVDISYITLMIRAQYKGLVGTVQDSDQRGAHTVLTYHS